MTPRTSCMCEISRALNAAAPSGRRAARRPSIPLASHGWIESMPVVASARR